MLRGGLAVLLAVASVCAEEVALKTGDGWELPATVRSGAAEGKKAPAMILVHMMNGTRADWNDFAERLVKDGYVVLAFDSRGHGGSRKDGKAIGWRDFSPTDYQGMVGDVKAAWDLLLARKDVDPGRVCLVGASIGANVALAFAAEEPGVRAIALLSPGKDYHGVKTEEANKKYKRAIFFSASEEDDQPFRDTEALMLTSPGERTYVPLKGAGHGTQMLGRQPSLQGDLLEFFGEH